MACFTVVENSGYERECDVRTAFSTSQAAWNWAKRHYGADELETLHVQIAREYRIGDTIHRTYEY